MATAAARYVLSQIDDAFLEEVCKKGEYIKEKLLASPKVKSVSGLGLMMGIEVDSKKKAADIVKEALAGGVMALTAKNKVRLLPPLNIPYEDIDEGLEILIKAIES